MLECYRTVQKRNMDFKECINIAWQVFKELAEEAEVEEEQEAKSEHEHEMQGHGSAKKRKRRHALSHNYDFLTDWNAVDRVHDRITNDHHLIQVRHVQKRCVICSSGQTDRRTNSKCMECNVHLHDDCFKLFHSQRVLKKILNKDEIKQAIDCLRKPSSRNKKPKHK